MFPRSETQHSRRKIRLVALAIFAFAACSLFWASEALLRISHPDPGIVAMELASAAGRTFDARSRRSVVADLVRKGVGAVPRLVPAAMFEPDESGDLRSIVSVDGTEFLPLSGVAGRTTVLCNETGEYAIYESDEHGFRNPPGVWDQTPSDIVLIGDSFTIGECVASGENLADQIRADWPKLVNLGYSGHSPLFELGTLVEYGPSLRPATTLWFYFENDLAWFDLDRSTRSPLLMRYLEPDFSQRLMGQQEAINLNLMGLIEAERAQPDEASPHQKDLEDRLTLREELRDFLRLVRVRQQLARLRDVWRPIQESPDIRLFGQILDRAREEVARWGGEIIVVYLPGVWRFDSSGNAPGWARWDARDSIRQLSSGMNLRFIDIHSAFERHPDPLSLYSFRGESRIGSPHLNAAGYAYAARILRSELQR